MSTHSDDEESLAVSSQEGSARSSKTIMLGKFRLIAVLGKGAMGKVVRAEDTKLKRHVAIKCLRGKSESSASRVEQFVREARSAATLEHPNIVQIYEVGEAGGYHYIAMELIEGGNLSSLIKACGSLDLHRACQLAAETAEGLAHAAQLGVVHRDIKPQNLMLTRSGRCKITDFGLARIDDPADGFKMPKGAVGTPAYMAPEVIRRQSATAKSDVYSLGCVLFFLLTGRPPFNVRERDQLLRAHLEEAPPNICSLRPDLPESLSKILNRALAKDPDDRPTPDTFGKQLRAHTIPVGSGSQVLTLASSPFISAAIPTAKKSRTFMYGALAGTALALAAVATTVIVLKSSNKVEPASAAPPTVAAVAAPVQAAMAAPTIVPVAAPAPIPAPAPVATVTPASVQAPVVASAAAPSTPAPVAVAAVARPVASGSEIGVGDAAAILAAAKSYQKITLVGVATSVHVDGAKKLATITFADNHDLHVTYYSRVYSAMTKKFGGRDGSGLAGKTVRITSYPALLDGKPDIIINSVGQIDVDQ